MVPFVTIVNGVKRIGTPRCVSLLNQLFDHLPSKLMNPISFELGVEMLRGLQTILAQAPNEMQAVFAKVNFGSPLTKMLHYLDSIDEKKQHLLILETINTFTAVFAGCTPTKDSFRQGFGFVNLVSAISKPCLPWEGLLDALSSLVVEGPFVLNSRDAIRHSEALQMFFLLYPIFTPDLQGKFLEWFQSLLHTSFNLLQASAAGFLLDFCKLLSSSESPGHLRQIVGIIQSLGSFSVSAAEYRTLLNLLKGGANRSLPTYYGPLIQALTHMSGPSKNPLVYFQFFDAESSASFPQSFKFFRFYYCEFLFLFLL